jgi:hypothetical protein
MKKMLMVACAAIMLVSCGKEEVADNNAISHLKNSSYRVWTGTECNSSGGSCLPDADVNGNDQKVIDDVFDVIDKGNQLDIKAVFVDNQRTLKKYLSTKIVSSVLAQTVAVTATDGSSSGSIHYMVFTSTGQSGSVAEVYPFLD